MNSLGKRLYTIRTEKGFSKKDLAEALHISETLLEEWEADKTSPNLTNLQALCLVLEVSSDELLGLSQGLVKRQNLSRNRTKLIYYQVHVFISLLFAFSLGLYVHLLTFLQLEMRSGENAEWLALWQPSFWFNNHLVFLMVLLILAVIYSMVCMCKYLINKENHQH